MKAAHLLAPLLMGICAFSVKAEIIQTASPDGRNVIGFTHSADSNGISVSRNGKTVFTPSPFGLMISTDVPFGPKIGPEGHKVTQVTTTEGVDAFQLPVGKTTSVRAPYRETVITLQKDDALIPTLQLVLRAYDDGVALRYVIPSNSGPKDLKLQKELTSFRFAADFDCWGLNQGRFENSFEGEHDPFKASDLRAFHLYQSPVVCKTGEGDTTFALAESNVRNYPGAYYAGREDGGLGLEVILTPRKDNSTGARFNTITAKIDASQGFATPWRVVMIGDSAGKLIENNLITALAEPQAFQDTSWIKPGLVAWDWWNGSQVDIPNPGMNTDTYKAFADFAADMGLDYIMLDEGWSIGSTVEANTKADITKPKPEVDLTEIIRYAADKGVRVWVWVQWEQLNNQMDEALAAYEKWGIAGIKVDFMNRNDQDMVDYYHRLLSTAAKHRIMVNLHGAYPPNGLLRTYPNYVTQEGVLGAENNKWSNRITAQHNVRLAFTRGLLGPSDYTPGGFRHATPEDFPQKMQFFNPYVMTTRGHALALYVIYDSPLQMVSDSPPTYKKADGTWEDGVDFLQAVPATWDETRFISGDIDDYVTIARRKGDTWYVGAITNDKGRNITLPLSFLKGKHAAKVWADGDTISTLKTSERKVNSSDRISLTLAPNGGGVIVLKPAP
ncbi:glycoside hydrolase family 97 protein [Asticcacaulis tiandongensis]|uniref:glycoside hydrolase family 97 protein n=1 Tax=Asticcacaulis tiandongensis TaxID=2565365 RepID=UPI00112A4720|nr:glycoside hydrolase family 97 protein [Asticcacaulis tiandongensis]